ncbi:MAG: lysine--tRNA ligase [Eubacteriales bacterium]
MGEVEDNINISEQTEEQLSEILKIRRDKLAALKSQGKDPFEKVKFEREAIAAEIIDGFEAFEGKTVTIAGRLMSKRIMGKASFAHILDKTAKIQIYVRRDDIGEEEYIYFKQLDIGDIIGVSGEVFKTHAGEVSVRAAKIELLSKSMMPLPEKWHGLKDSDLRYRQRYVDLIVNPEVKDVFVARSKIIKLIREYLDEKGFMEVETPILQTHAGGASARPFITHHNTLDIDMYMRIALELHLKRLIVGGLEKVYEIGRVFRNEGISIKHNPEFTLMELYEAYTDYNGMMEITEGIFSYVAEKLFGTTKITYQGNEINLTPPWTKMTMNEAVKKYTGADFYTCKTDEEAVKLAKSIGVDSKAKTMGELLNEAFEQFVEEKLIQPTFIIDYPIEVSPLAKKKKDNPKITERFELFITAREMANAFSELNDPIDQRERFSEQAKRKAAGDEEAQLLDEDFVTALSYGMPPTGGLGIGIDRMVMLLTDCYSIRDVILFPTMKPIK